MKTLLPPHFVQEEVTSDDFVIASLAWGFTLGFGWLTVSSAIAQTAKTWRRYGSRSIHVSIRLPLPQQCITFGLTFCCYHLEHIHLDDMARGGCMYHLFGYMLAVSERDDTTQVSLTKYLSEW